MEKRKVLAIIGKSGTGKTYLIKNLKTEANIENMYFPIPYTTRPQRENEVDGVEYFFDKNITQYKDKTLCWSEYVGWFYCYMRNTFHPSKVNIIAVDLQQLKMLYNDNTIDLKVLELVCDPGIIRKRLSYRPDTVPGEYLRRIKADDEEFSKFIFQYDTYDYIRNEQNSLRYKFDTLTKIEEKVNSFFK